MASYSHRLRMIYGDSESEVRRNLKSFTFTFPDKNGNPNNKSVAVNSHVMYARLMWANKMLTDYCIAHKTGYTISQLDSFSWRRIRGGVSLSMHSGAIAVDINWDKNPMGYSLVTDMPMWFVACFEKAGFLWGGKFRFRKDAMHFELREHTEPVFARTVSVKIGPLVARLPQRYSWRNLLWTAQQRQRSLKTLVWGASVTRSFAGFWRNRFPTPIPTYFYTVTEPEAEGVKAIAAAKQAWINAGLWAKIQPRVKVTHSA